MWTYNTFKHCGLGWFVTREASGGLFEYMTSGGWSSNQSVGSRFTEGAAKEHVAALRLTHSADPLATFCPQCGNTLTKGRTFAYCDHCRWTKIDGTKADDHEPLDKTDEEIAMGKMNAAARRLGW